MKKKRIGWRDLLPAAALTGAIIAIAVTVTVHFRPLYYLDLRALDIPAQSGYSAEVCRENYNAVVDYLSLFSKKELVLPSLAMSEGGRIHFADVRTLVCSIVWIGIGCAVAFALLRWIFQKSGDGVFLLTAVFLAAVPIVVGGAALLWWDRLFILFHQIFFDNDYWIFDPATDPIIEILPDTFFLHAALLLLGLILAGCLLCLGIYRYRQAKHRTSEVAQ